MRMNPLCKTVSPWQGVVSASHAYGLPNDNGCSMTGGLGAHSGGRFGTRGSYLAHVERIDCCHVCHLLHTGSSKRLVPAGRPQPCRPYAYCKGTIAYALVVLQKDESTAGRVVRLALFGCLNDSGLGESR